MAKGKKDEVSILEMLGQNEQIIVNTDPNNGIKGRILVVAADGIIIMAEKNEAFPERAMVIPRERIFCITSLEAPDEGRPTTSEEVDT